MTTSFWQRFLKPSKSPQTDGQTFILEPILTPSGLIDSPGDDTPDLDSVGDSDLPDFDFDSSDLPEVADAADPIADEAFQPLSFFTDEPPTPQFESGVFVVGESGQVGIDFLYDGGGYKGELAIFSLDGMEDLEGEAFIQEAANRALSNSTDGYIIINDASEGAKFEGSTRWEGNFNSGDYQGVKTFEMRAGDTFGVMLVPRGTVQQVFDNPDIEGATRPLFSMADANPESVFHVGQIADVTGDGNTFVMEDMRVDGFTDRDYNDIIFQVRGATAEAVDLDDVIDIDRDWRLNDTGQALIEYAKAYVEPTNDVLVNIDAPLANQPLIGIIDTGFSADNPDLDYSNMTFGRDLVDGDDNPLFAAGEDPEHGTHVLGIIAAQQDNDFGINGINDDAPLWVGRAVGSGRWADSLVEFVDAAQESGQPNAVVNLSLDLTQIDANGDVTTRYEFTPQERAAIEYARQHNVLIVVAAGNDGGVMSALGQASQEFDNLIAVGAAERFDPTTSAWQGSDRSDYSSYGYGLDIMAYGGTIENPETSLMGDFIGELAGTSIATAKVTGAVSQVWAANPDLSYRQVIEILKNTATDLGETGFDLETGAGLLNMAAAIHLAKATQPEEHYAPPSLIPETWSGEGQFTPSERAVATEFMGKYYDWQPYTIQSGDTLSAIALRTMGSGTAPYYNFIAQKNGIANPNLIYPGNTILIPKQVAAPTPAPIVTQPGPPQRYIVKAGDTLWSIAQRFLGNGNRWREILKTPTGGTFTDAEARRLQVGQSVYLPVKQTTGPGKPVAPVPQPTPVKTPILTPGEFNNWRNWPEYSTRNPFPSKGKNCTWYAHGRMMQLGYSEYALDSMLGNAGTWDNTAGRGARVVYTPQAPCIVVWEAGVGGAGSVGHVAVVERVNADGSILISESNWAGKSYNTRTIYPGSRSWPSKFIVVPKA
jgi:surface antigen/LysM repeat protein